MAYKEIITEISDSILTITLNRPEKLNAFTGTMMTEMIDAFRAANKNDDVRVIIVTGSGRAFCAGADLSAGASTFDSTARADRQDRNAGSSDS
ncbi:MAG: enoyl-CoA hydratase/isomerase family protein, partial [Alphaproteobacteria bacterium]|nr:enoyl-CoA hydratase/isomerase family protein [Alphaproteobacteria bacterium]